MKIIIHFWMLCISIHNWMTLITQKWMNVTVVIIIQNRMTLIIQKWMNVTVLVSEIVALNYNVCILQVYNNNVHVVYVQE